jgi:hypothetical protein
MDNSINIKLGNKTDRQLSAPQTNHSIPIRTCYYCKIKIKAQTVLKKTKSRQRSRNTTISTYRKYHSSTYRKDNNPAIENTATSLAFPMCANKG